MQSTNRTVTYQIQRLSSTLIPVTNKDDRLIPEAV